MQFFDVINQRRSIRSFQSTWVEQSKIEAVLEAARLAPSAGDLQAYLIVIVEDPATKEQLAEAASGQGFIAEAPITLVFFTDRLRSESRYGERGGALYCLQDATIAAAYAQLAVADLGMACCWVGAFDEARVARLLGAPSHLRAVVMLPIGHAAETPERPSRRPLSELTRHERF